MPLSDKAIVYGRKVANGINNFKRRQPMQPTTYKNLKSGKRYKDVIAVKSGHDTYALVVVTVGQSKHKAIESATKKFHKKSKHPSKSKK